MNEDIDKYLDEEYEKAWAENDDPDAPIISRYLLAHFFFLAGAAAKRKEMLKLIGNHERHWRVLGAAFGLTLGGVDGDVEDLDGNASQIIEHCLNMVEAQRKKDVEIAEKKGMNQDCSSSGMRGLYVYGKSIAYDIAAAIEKG